MTFADSVDAKHRPTATAFDSFVESFNETRFFADAAHTRRVKLVAGGRALRVSIHGKHYPLEMSVVYVTRTANIKYQSMIGAEGKSRTPAHFAWDQVRQYRLDAIRNV
jgi:hypothetical protein